MPSSQAPSRPLLLLPLLPLLALLALSACATYDLGRTPVPGLVAEGQYEAAVVVAARLYEADPNSVRAEEEYRGASVAMLIERARRATFKDRDDEALFHLEQAAKIDPDNGTTSQWILKARRKLCASWLDRAQEFSGKGDLISATEAFERAIFYDPESLAAMQGIGRMLLLTNYRAGRGQAYYREGIRSLRAFWLHRARAEFAFAGDKYMPGDTRSHDRSEAVKVLLAEQRIAQAQEFEREYMYFAAGNEYRLALLLDPENQHAESGRERMNLEMGAVEKLELAEWLRMRGRFEAARSALSEGLELTELQVDRFEAGSIDIDEEEFAILYSEALRLESDFQYPDAVKQYERLLEVAGYYEDAITRRAVLLDSIARTEDLYARAMEASDSDERIGYLREIQLIWPEFLNVDSLLEELGALDD